MPFASIPLLLSGFLVGLSPLQVASQSIPWSSGIGAGFETYSFSDADEVGLETVSLTTLPFSAETRLAPWLHLDLNGAWASGTLTRPDGSRHTLSGTTDTALRLSVPLGQDRVTLAATALLPTGQSTYAEGDAEVAGIVAADLLPFRISNWGSGGGLDMTGSLAVPLGAVNLGARLGYQIGRDFELLAAETFQYRPGNQLYGRIALDGNLGTGRAAGRVTVYRFEEDLVNDQNLYRAGNRVEAMASFTFPAGSHGRAAVYLGGLHRERGQFLDGTDDTPGHTVMMLGGEFTRPFRYGSLKPEVHVRSLGNAEGVGQGFVGGVGLSAELRRPGSSFTLLPSVRVRLGHLQVRPGSESGITGFDLATGIRFGGTAR